MKILHALERDAARPLALAIGFFDGFHRGHREIALQTRRLRRPGWRSGVLTFSNHPASFLRPGSEPPMLFTPEERLAAFAAAEFEECLFTRFDAAVATLAPETFLDALVDRLGVRAIVVGSSFRFGHKRAGDVSSMRAYCERRGVDFVPVENATDDGERISSTRIRALVARGDVANADRMIGGSGYEIRGTVAIGAGRGHDLGFPTANVSPPEKLLPKDGVYAGVARYDGRDRPALISIGTNPQFGGTTRTVEAWLRDFHHTIYGRELALRELRFLRDQKTFAGVDELVAQMHRDLDAVAFPSYG